MAPFATAQKSPGEPPGKLEQETETYLLGRTVFSWQGMVCGQLEQTAVKKAGSMSERISKGPAGWHGRGVSLTLLLGANTVCVALNCLCPGYP